MYFCFAMFEFISDLLMSSFFIYIFYIAVILFVLEFSKRCILAYRWKPVVDVPRL